MMRAARRHQVPVRFGATANTPTSAGSLARCEPSALWQPLAQCSGSARSAGMVELEKLDWNQKEKLQIIFLFLRARALSALSERGPESGPGQGSGSITR
jgi:hypothetical protein